MVRGSRRARRPRKAFRKRWPGRHGRKCRKQCRKRLPTGGGYGPGTGCTACRSGRGGKHGGIRRTLRSLSNASGQGNGAAVSINTDTMSAAAGETAEAQRLGLTFRKYQGGNINWTKVKEAGIDFVMVRVGYRTEGHEGLFMRIPRPAIICRRPRKTALKWAHISFHQPLRSREARKRPPGW